jgi:hypothetical protein
VVLIVQIVLQHDDFGKPDCTNVYMFHSFLLHVAEVGIEDLDCTLDH